MRARAHTLTHTDYSFLVHSNGQFIIVVGADFAGWLQESLFSGHLLFVAPCFASFACKPCTPARQRQPNFHYFSVSLKEEEKFVGTEKDRNHFCRDFPKTTRSL